MKYIFALLLTLSSFGTAMADSRDTTIANVPFDFVIGNKTFTAGTYRITSISVDPRAGLRIQSSDGKTSLLFQPTSLEFTSNDQAKLQFLHEGNMYFLTGIFTASDTYTLAPKHRRQEAAKPDETVTVAAP
jgi:hypothetical protein